MPITEITTGDGHRIACHWWHADGPSAVVHLLHGLGEHAGRYRAFARDVNAAGIALVAHNHRGHGESARIAGHFADRDGWNLVVDDALRVQAEICNAYPALPMVLFGHSMGSYIAQSLAMRHPQHLAMLVLSGSTYRRRSEVRAGHWLSRLLALTGVRRRSQFLNARGFDAFNAAFEPARTRADWISRDDEAVDAYLADPLCMDQFTNGLWRDLTAGLLEINSPAGLARIPATLPVLIFGGERDPVGGQLGLSRLDAMFRQTGHVDVTLRIYPGGRHEMLNETNRDEVAGDVIGWIAGRI